MYKPGDRVVVVKGQETGHAVFSGYWRIGNTQLVDVIFDDRTLNRENGKAFTRVDWIVPEHIYNSRLYKALQEQEPENSGL